MVEDQNGLRQLIEAGIALGSELSLDALLHKLVETAGAVTGARYAALGVLDPSRTALERFITHGIDAETQRRIGELPRGRGILGVLIHDAQPLRLRDLQADPRSAGFPPGHPDMRTFLGVPVLLRGVAYGNLYLTEKIDGGDFTAEDEELVRLLASQAAVAIENARLYESSTRWLRQLEATNAVANELVTESELPRLLELIAASLRELIEARIVTVWLPAPDGTLQLQASAGEWPHDLDRMHVAPGSSKLARVFERGSGERVDSLLEDHEVDQALARRLGLKSGLWMPLLVRGSPVGVIAAYDKLAAGPHFSDGDRRLAETLAARAAVAIDLRQRLSRESVRSMLAAQESERSRIARELHDETGQALSAIVLALKPLETRVGAEAIEPVRELVVHALADVRRLALQLRPAVLDDFGLLPALERLVRTLREQAGLAVELETNLERNDRLPAELESTLYRIAQEGTTNILRHARARNVRLTVRRSDASVTLTLEDDGDGFVLSEVAAGRVGVRGIRERIALLAGTLDLDTAPGRGTRLVTEIPIEPSRTPEPAGEPAPGGAAVAAADAVQQADR